MGTGTGAGAARERRRRERRKMLRRVECMAEELLAAWVLGLFAPFGFLEAWEVEEREIFWLEVV